MSTCKRKYIPDGTGDSIIILKELALLNECDLEGRYLLPSVGLGPCMFGHNVSFLLHILYAYTVFVQQMYSEFLYVAVTLFKLLSKIVNKTNPCSHGVYILV